MADQDSKFVELSKLPSVSQVDEDYNFECPRCHTILRVPLVVDRFRCPKCNDRYILHMLREDDPLVLSRNSSRRQMEAQLHRRIASGSGLPEQDNPNAPPDLVKVSRVERETHEQYNYEFFKCPPEIPSHVFDKLKELFLDYDPLRTGKVMVRSLHDHCPHYLKRNKRWMIMVRSVVDRNLDSFGFGYKIRFSNFLDELTKYAKAAESKWGRTTTHAKLSRLDTVNVLFENAELDRYKSYGCIGRLSYNFSKWWKAFGHSRRSFIPIWNQPIAVLEAKYGANIASVFYFFRWVYVLNMVVTLMFLFILVPAWIDYDWNEFSKDPLTNQTGDGVFTGVGMETSWMFYGEGFQTEYSSYRMDVAWIIVTGFMLFFSLIAVVAHIGSGHLGKIDQHFQLAHAVFGGWDHHVTYKAQAKLLRKSIFTAIDTSMKRKADWEVKHKWTWVTLAPRLFGYTASLFLLAVALSGIDALINYEHEQIVPRFESNSKFLIVPGVIALGNYVSAFVMRKIVDLEGHRKASARFLHFYVRQFTLRMAVILMLVFVTASTTDKTVEQNLICKETQVGLLFYRVVFMDFVVEAVVSVIAPATLVALRSLWWYCHDDETRGKVSINAQQLDMLDPDGDGANNLSSPLSSPSGDAKHNADFKEDRQKEEKKKLVTDGVLGSHYVDPQNDPLKLEFDIPTNIVNIIYRQALIWTGASFCPVLPLLSFVLSFLLFYIKKFQVTSFSKRPRRPMDVPKQNTFFRSSIVVTMLVVIIPFTFFLRRIVDCGPHQLPLTIDGVLYEPGLVPILNSDGTLTNGSLSIIDVFLKHMDTLPSAVAVAIAYMSNVFILWMVICVAVVYLAVLIRRHALLAEEIGSIANRLKMEIKEKQAIIRVYDIVVGEDEARGRDLFKIWIEELGPLGHRFGPGISREGYGDMIKLAKLNDDQLDGLIGKLGGNSEDVRHFIAAVHQERMSLVKAHFDDEKD